MSPRTSRKNLNEASGMYMTRIYLIEWASRNQIDDFKGLWDLDRGVC